MPGIKFIDNKSSFKSAVFWSNVFATGSVVIALALSIVSLIVTIANIKKYGQAAGVAFVAVTVIVFAAGLVMVLYANDGRYSRQSWPNDKEYTYFGTMNNNEPHGWGKLFDKNGKIVYIGEFKNGSPEGYGKFYKKYIRNADGKEKMFVWKEGEFSKGQGEGYVIIREVKNDKVLVSYDGEMVNDQKCGQGIFYDYYENGRLYATQEGGWVEDQRWGYITEFKYDENGRCIQRYKSVYCNGGPYGKLVNEYEMDGSKYVCIGLDYGKNDSRNEKVYYNGADKELIFLIEGKEELTEEDRAYLKKLSEKWPCPKETIWD